MLSLEEALDRILKCIVPLGYEVVPLIEAAGRIADGAISTPQDLPLFDNSAMDGYAVCAEDVAGARANSPVSLHVIGSIPAGSVFEGKLRRGCCVRIFTGSPLPTGADAVVMQEDTEIDGRHPELILIRDKVRPWENVRLKGQDVKRGTNVIVQGERFTAAKIGLFAAIGLDSLPVRQRPTVSVVATGSELTEPGQELFEGKIYESNRQMLATLVRGAGAIPKVLPLVPDSLSEIRTGLERAFSESDAVISSGGVSVGEHDLVKSAFEALGGTLEFWRVSIKPGKPFVFGRLGRKLFFGLPGNPVSAAVTFLMLVRPALLRWQGAADIHLPAHPGVLAEPLANRGERPHFMSVRLDAEDRVHSAGLQASHAIASFAKADGLVKVPAGTTLPTGALVRVLRWEI